MCRMESEQSADEVLAAVSTSLKSYPFDFQGAKIITGQEEGAYGWITINYLLGRFTQVKTSHFGGGSKRVTAIIILGNIWVFSKVNDG